MGKTMEKEVIFRKRYSDKIKPFIGKQIIKVLTGQRRVGKSYVLKQTIKHIKRLDKSANIVYNHLLYCGYEVTIGSDGNREIDFIARKRGEKIYVQVCYLLHDEKTIEREFGNLEKIKDNYPKIVVSMDEFTGSSRNGIRHSNLREFLSAGLHLPSE